MVSVFLSALFLDAGVLPYSSQSSRCHCFPPTAVSPVQRGRLRTSSPLILHHCRIGGKSCSIDRNVFLCFITVYKRALWPTTLGAWFWGAPSHSCPLAAFLRHGVLCSDLGIAGREMQTALWSPLKYGNALLLGVGVNK